MKDGVFLSDFSSEHFYKIQSVSRSDAGYYRCYAKNSVGTIISEKIRLTVACKESFYNFNGVKSLHEKFTVWKLKNLQFYWFLKEFGDFPYEMYAIIYDKARLDI